jgi:hypothetical protein
MTVRNELTHAGRVERGCDPADAPPTPEVTPLNSSAAGFDALEQRMEHGFFTVTEQMIEQRASVESGYERLDKSLHALGGSLARLERKLDRVLALSVESRGRSRQ